MSSSSRVALIAACVLLAGGSFMYIRSQDTRAPALTQPVVEAMLKRAAAGLNQRDSRRILALATEDAILFGVRRVQLERAINRAMREIAPGRLDITWRNLVVNERGNVGTAEFDVSVEERIGSTDAVYFVSHITLDLVKVRRATWLGLGKREEWLVRRAVSSEDLMLRE
ncbi:MAG: hypothetical protein GX446_08155 [Chthonomonadales bacterium]|nr:hypothetical protein [Chthonomonadales bacterium]